MKTTVLFRIAAVLLLLFSAGHTIGFRKTDPAWGVDALVTSMKTITFDAQGFQRSYWDFYVGFGLFVSVLIVFAAIVCWQLGSVPPGALRSMTGTCWSLAACFAVVTLLSWRFFFIVPLVFSLLITLCLVLGSWFAGRMV
jgi:hypothetical protein